MSNGYLVMQPDIHLRTRTTHSDMQECVEAAMAKVIELGYADPERIGLALADNSNPPLALRRGGGHLIVSPPPPSGGYAAWPG